MAIFSIIYGQLKRLVISYGYVLAMFLFVVGILLLALQIYRLTQRKKYIPINKAKTSHRGLIARMALRNLDAFKKQKLKKYMIVAGIEDKSVEEFEIERLTNALNIVLLVFTILFVLQSFSFMLGTKINYFSFRTVIGIIGLGWFFWFHSYNNLIEGFARFQNLVRSQVPSFVRMITMFLYSGSNVRDSITQAIRYLPENGLRESLLRASRYQSASLSLENFLKLVKDEVELPELMQFFDLLVALERTGESTEDKKFVLNMLDRNMNNFEHFKELKGQEIVESYSTVFSFVITAFFLGAFVMALAGPAFFLLLKVLGG